MYLDPGDGTLLLHSFLEFLELDSLLFEQAMTVHANARGRDSSVSARPRGIVAIQTRNLIVTSVDPVGKGNGLIRSIALVDADAGKGPGDQAAPQNQHRDANRHKSGAHHFLIFLRPDPNRRIQPLQHSFDHLRYRIRQSLDWR